MTLTASEINVCRRELGFNLITTDGSPWISTTQAFEQLIQPFLQAGASTTSSSAVTAASSATPAAITLTSPTGFAAFDKVVVDVDDRMETGTVQSISGSIITVLLSKAHSGTYPVMVDGGEGSVRQILWEISQVKDKLATVFGWGALKAVDEIQFYNSGKSQFGELGNQLKFWRAQLASVLGIPSAWEQRRAAGGALSVY
jgi:hypothetical protein